MVLNPGKCHFMLFGVKENEQFDLLCNDITLKYSSHEKILGVTIDSKLSFDTFEAFLWLHLFPAIIVDNLFDNSVLFKNVEQFFSCDSTHLISASKKKCSA